MTILELLILVFIIIEVMKIIISLFKGKKKKLEHIHNWVFVYKFKDGLNEYNKYYCSGCLTQCITYFNSRKGIVELTEYNTEKVIKE